MGTVDQPESTADRQELRLPPAVAEWLREQGVDAADLRRGADATTPTAGPILTVDQSALAVLRDLLAAARRIENQLSRQALNLRLANRQQQ